jgi:hypothetical protein
MPVRPHSISSVPGPNGTFTRYREIRSHEGADIFVIDVNSLGTPPPATAWRRSRSSYLMAAREANPRRIQSHFYFEPASAAARHPAILAIGPASDPTAPATPIRLAFDRVGLPGH